MSIVARIKEKCNQQGYTIASLERTTQIANGTISKWDDNRFSAEYLFRIATTLNTSMDYLFSGSEKQKDISVSPDMQEWIHLYKKLASCSPEVRNKCIGYIEGCIDGYYLDK